jgi:hypothetical protein
LKISAKKDIWRHIFKIFSPGAVLNPDHRK